MTVKISFDLSDPGDIERIRRLVGAPSAAGAPLAPAPVGNQTVAAAAQSGPLVPLSAGGGYASQGTVPAPLVPPHSAQPAAQPAAQSPAQGPTTREQALVADAEFRATGSLTETVTVAGQKLKLGEEVMTADGEVVVIELAKRGQALVLHEDGRKTSHKAGELLLLPATPDTPPAATAPATQPEAGPLVPPAQPAAATPLISIDRANDLKKAAMAAMAQNPAERDSIMAKVNGFLGRYGCDPTTGGAGFAGLPDTVANTDLFALIYPQPTNPNPAPAEPASGW